jgi:hypothetical protein
MKMKILEIEIIKTKSEKVRARADVHFEGFWLKGFKVVWSDKDSKDFVTPPSYLSGMGWRPLFRTDSPETWQEIQRQILDRYNLWLMESAAEGIKEEA